MAHVNIDNKINLCLARIRSLEAILPFFELDLDEMEKVLFPKKRRRQQIDWEWRIMAAKLKGEI